MDEIARYWAMVDATAGMTACWPWLGNRNDNGYGRINQQGQVHYAHRIALTVRLGRPIAPGMQACHHCDNPPCCNPLHLFEGSIAANMADAASKGRMPSGGRQAQAALSDDDAALIRTSTDRPAVLATRFGVSKRTVYRVLAGDTYRPTPEAAAS